MSETMNATPIPTRRRLGRVELAERINYQAREQTEETQRAKVDLHGIRQKLVGVLDAVTSALQDTDEFEEQLNVIDDRAFEVVRFATELELAECRAELARPAPSPPDN